MKNGSRLLREVRNYGVIDDSRKQRVKLNKTEMDVALFLAKEKEAIPKTQVSYVETDFEKDYNAYCGEMGFCKLMNICFSPIIDPSQNFSNDMGDAVWGNLRVDVKHTIHDPATLAVQNYIKNDVVDIYVLMTGIPPNLKYQGAMLKKDIVVEANLGNGPEAFENAYCMHSDKLEYWWWATLK